MTLIRWTPVFLIAAALIAVTQPLQLLKRKETPPFLRNQRIYNTAAAVSSYSSNSITTVQPYSDNASSYSSNSEQYASSSNNVAAASAAADSAASASAATSAAAAAAAASTSYSSYSPATTYSASSTYTQPAAAASYSGSGYSDSYGQPGSGSYGSYPSGSGSYGSGSSSYGSGSGSYGSSSGSYGSGSGSYGSYGSGAHGSYGSGSGSYDSGSYGGPSYSVSYPSGSGSMKGAFGPETLSFLSSLAPSLLLSGLLLPLAISSLLAASNSTSLFGRKKRFVEDDFNEDSQELTASLLDDGLGDLVEELYSDSAPVAKVIDTLEEQLNLGVHNKILADLIKKNGLMDAKNQCMEKIMCLGVSAGRDETGAKAKKLTRIVEALDKNGELPGDLKSRLAAARTKSSFCSAFICTSA